MSSNIGSAYVVVRAVTKGIGKDIEKGVADGAREAEPRVKLSGFKLGRVFGDGFAAGLRSRLATIGNDAGDSLGDSIGSRARAKIDKHLEGIGVDLIPGGSGNNPLIPGGGGGSNGDGKKAGAKWEKDFIKGIESFKIPTKPFFIVSAIPAIGGALKIVGAYAAQTLSLVTAIGPALIGVAGGVAGIYAAVGLGALVVKTAFAAKTPELARFKAYAISIAKEWKGVGIAAQQGMLPRFAAALAGTTKLIPIVEKGFGRIGVTIGNVAIQASKLTQTSLFRANLASVLNTSNTALGYLGSALVHVASAALNVLASAKPMILFLAKWALSFAKAADGAAKAGRESGRLTAFFQRATVVTRQLGHIVGEIWRGFVPIFKAAAGGGQDVLNRITALVTKFDHWSHSLSGQNAITKYFANARPIVFEFNGLIGDLFKLLGKSISGNGNTTVSFIQSLRKDVVPVLGTAGKALSGLGPTLVTLTQSFGQFLQTASQSGALGAFTGTLMTIFNTLSWILKLPVAGKLFAWAASFAVILGVINKIPGVGKLLGFTITKGVIPILKNLGKAILFDVIPFLYEMAIASQAAIGPWGWLAEAVIAIGAALVYAYFHFQTFRDIVDGVINVFRSGLSWIIDHWRVLVVLWLGPVALAAQVIVANWDNIYNAVQFVWDLMINVGNFIKNVFVGYIQLVWKVWSTIFGWIGSLISKVFSGAVGAIQWFWNTLINAVNTIKSVFAGIFEPFRIAAATVFNWVASLWNNTIGKLSWTVPSWIPFIGGNTIAAPQIPMIQLAKGGVIQPTPGGTIARIAEAGRAERVEPLDKDGLSNRDHALISAMGGSGFRIGHITVQSAPGENAAESLPRALRRTAFVLGGAT